MILTTYALCKNIDKYSYIYDYSLEKPDNEILIGFMIAPDDYKLIYEDTSFLDYCTYENDRQYGDYNKILLLENFGKTLIDKYAINMFRKYGTKTVLVIVSSKEEAIGEAVGYLLTKDEISGHSNVHVLYQKNINRYLYPGYNASYNDKTIRIKLKV